MAVPFSCSSRQPRSGARLACYKYKAFSRTMPPRIGARLLMIFKVS